MKRILILCLAFFMLVSVLAACGEEGTVSGTSSQIAESGTGSSEGESSGSESTEEPPAWQKTSEPGVYRLPADVSVPDGCFVTMNVSDGVLLFRMMKSGLDSFSAELINWDLKNNAELGRLSVPDGMWQIGQIYDGGFYVLDQGNGTLRFYGADGKERSVSELKAGGFVSTCIVSYDGKTVFYAEPITGKPVLYDLTAEKRVEIGYDGVISDILGEENGCFYFTDLNGCFCRLEGEKVVQIKSDFSANFVPPYILFPTKKGYNISSVTDSALHFFPADSTNEFPIAATEGYLVAMHDDGIRLYDLENRKAERLLKQCRCTSYASFTGDGLLVLLCEENGLPVVYVIVPNEVAYTEDLELRDSGEDDLEDPIVSEWNGSKTANAEAKRILDTYGVVVGFESDDFDDQIFWYEIEKAAASEVEPYLFYASEYLAMLPQGIMKEIHPGKEPVIFFCKEIKGNVAGFACDYTRHPFVAIEIGYDKDQFVENLAHEIFHLLFEQNQNMLPDLALWNALTPAEYYLNSYTDLNNTEYTPYGDGQFEDIRFLTPYARTFEAEDRAVTGEMLFVSARNGHLNGYFRDCRYIREKANMLCELLRKHYPSCSSGEAPYWEKIFGYKA